MPSRRFATIAGSSWPRVLQSSEEGIVLVDENVVANNPDSNQSSGDDSEHASSEKLSSGWGGVLGEDHDEEAWSDAHWGKEDQDNNWEVPVIYSLRIKKKFIVTTLLSRQLLGAGAVVGALDGTNRSRRRYCTRTTPQEVGGSKGEKNSRVYKNKIQELENYQE
jgi:hypothetical protein